MASTVSRTGPSRLTVLLDQTSTEYSPAGMPGEGGPVSEFVDLSLTAAVRLGPDDSKLHIRSVQGALEGNTVFRREAGGRVGTSDMKLSRGSVSRGRERQLHVSRIGERIGPRGIARTKAVVTSGDQRRKKHQKQEIPGRPGTNERYRPSPTVTDIELLRCLSYTR